MRIRIFWVITLLFTALSLSLAAQEESVFAPFVSRLQGEVRNNLVRLSWQDSPDVRGPVYIFRSNNPIEGNFPPLGIRPVEIPYGVQSFVDELEYGGTYHYFAAASDLTGRRFDLLISSNNLLNIQIQPMDGSVPVPAAAPMETAPLARVWSGISSLEAVPQGDRVLIAFSAENVRSAALYRSIRPITNTPDLLGAVIVQTGITSPFTDFPVPGIPYFYAVIDEDDLVRGTLSIVPGINSTRLPVEVSVSSGALGLDAPAQMIRSMPLPELAAQAVSPGADPATMPPQVDLNPQLVRALDTIPSRSPVDPLSRTPRVFAMDMEAYSAGGEDQALSSIVRGSFSQRNWESARNELTRFLALPRSPETTARARFYLGQSFYFLNRPREGLFEFMAIQDLYPRESREWIQASLDLIRY